MTHAVSVVNKIIKIDEDNLQVIVQSGVITQELQVAVQEKGLYYAMWRQQIGERKKE